RQRRKVDLRDLLAVSVEAAVLGGREVNSEEHDNVVDKVTWSRDIPADILEKIEGGKDVPPETLTVWIDPLDATKEYTENLVKYVTTMVCVALEGKPVIGVIHQPFTGFTGYKVLSLLEMPVSDADSVEQADVYVHITFIKKWDICAGAALLNALGGYMTTLKGEAIDYSGTPLNKGGLVASIGVDHKALVEKLPDWDPEKH
ncbi:Inositol monophosphatase 3, partial [Nibea albiflora]